MAKKDDRNLNITIKNQEEQKDEVVISVSTVIKKLRKYVLIWIVVAVVFFVAAFGYATVTTHVSKPSLVALISFSYDGIEKGLDPNGRDFDPNTVKNPAVIESALDSLDMDMKQLESIRQGIRLVGIKPKDAVDRLTLYDKVLDTNGNVSAVEKMLDTTYFPTQYRVIFDYNATTLTDSEAVEVLNAILTNYKTYFYKAYGYNESLGSAVTAVNYEDYDYSEAVDVFKNSLDTLSKYVKQLSTEDQTRFRSADTGYTFTDLYEAIQTVQNIDLDKVSSYVTVNNLTKNKDDALAYYEYRIKDLNRRKTQYEEQLASYDTYIENYKKDQIIIFGNGSDETTTESTVTSEQYDKMVEERSVIAQNLSDAKRSIEYYKDRHEALKNNPVGSTDKTEKVEKDLAALNEKINNLVEIVNKTSDDYYRNVTFKNAYSLLVPATNTASDRVSHIIENAKSPLIMLEAGAFFVFFGVAFVEALITDSRKRKLAKEAEAAAKIKKYSGGNDDEDDDDTADDIIEAIEEIAEDDAKENKSEKSNAPAKNKKKK